MSILIRGMEWDGRPHKALFTVKDGEPVVIVETALSYDDKDIKVYPVEIKPVARGGAKMEEAEG